LTSVVNAIKQLIGIHPEDTSFDLNVIFAINSAINILADIGVSELEDVVLTDTSMTWDELLGGRTDIEYVKTYIAQRVKMIFDPPTSSAANEAMKSLISELEFRISTK
jgi:hypothetical protein